MFVDGSGDDAHNNNNSGDKGVRLWGPGSTNGARWPGDKASDKSYGYTGKKLERYICFINRRTPSFEETPSGKFIASILLCLEPTVIKVIPHQGSVA